MKLQRASGILAHVTSLPSRYGIGDFGPAAYQWIDRLAQARQRWWQVLPLGPAAQGNCPYLCYSAMAGNPLLISPELLVKQGLLRQSDLPEPDFPASHVDFPRVIALKTELLFRAWERFKAGSAARLRSRLAHFHTSEKDWIDDYALFMALRESYSDAPWEQWPNDLLLRKPDALARARHELDDSIQRHRFIQFLFHQQLQTLRRYARRKKVGIIGDLPIFVSGDSADVWSNPKLFLLDATRRPRFVAGVPPDYFSKTGQRWGNPLYDWKAMEREHFAWWTRRMRIALRQADIVRLDHFRAFAAFWRIPADSPTAQRGKWVKGPGVKLFAALSREFGHLPMIAEDLGLITPDVEALRRKLSIPGMRVLQFAFGSDASNPFLPHNFEPATVVYTGTHDNDTSAGWYASLNASQQAQVRRYVPHIHENPGWELIQLAWTSVAQLAIAPLQDLLSLGSDTRMNTPGTTAGNWGWRITDDQLAQAPFERLSELTQATGRV